MEIGTLVVRVGATDEDSGQNGEIVYSILNCTEFSPIACPLVIGSTTGSVPISLEFHKLVWVNG